MHRFLIYFFCSISIISFCYINIFSNSFNVDQKFGNLYDSSSNKSLLTCDGGTLTGGDIVCNGNNSTLLTLSGHTGVIEKWQSSSTVDFANPSDISNTSSTYLVQDIMTSTFYRVIINDGACDTFSTTAFMEVQWPTSVSISDSINDLPNGMYRSTKNTVTSNFTGAESIVSEDIDGDGDIDILASSPSLHDIIWYENDGTQTYIAHTITNNFHGVSDVKIVDIDGDGDMDILATSFNYDDVAWWENNGVEVFTLRLIDGSFNGASDVFAVDLDGDGDKDVIATAAYGHEIAWWENVVGNGNVWTKHVISSSFVFANSIYAIDIDKDGDIDVLGGAEGNDKISWWENDGSQIFTEFIVTSTFDGVSSVHSADLNGDGYLDILATGYNADEVSWWENDGNQVFSKNDIAINFNSAYNAYPIDFDADGDLDVVASAFSMNEVSWWENESGNGSVWTKHLVSNQIISVQSIYADDMDLDGDIDILCAALNTENIVWWENVLTPAELISSEPDNSICAGDTIAFTASGGINYEFFINRVSVQNGSDYIMETSSLNNLDTVHVLTTNAYDCDANSVDFIISVGQATQGGVVSSDTTVCSVFNSTVLLLNGYQGSIIKWESSEYSDFSVATDIWTTTDTLAVEGLIETTYFRALVKSGACDEVYSTIGTITVNSLGGIISGDTSLCVGLNTILTLNGYTGTVEKWQSSMSPGFDIYTDIDDTTNMITIGNLNVTTYYRAVVNTGSCIAASTVHGVQSLSATPSNIAEFVNDLPNGLPRNTEHIITDNFNGSYSVVGADLDGDGDMDVIGAASYAGQIKWWENDGNQTFTEHLIANSFGGVQSVVVSDVDDDGDLDIVGSALSISDVAWWENDGNQTFTQHVIDYNFSGASDINVADIDNDGDIDVFGSAYYSDEISWWENDGSENFTKNTIASSFDGAWSVFADDIDNDGDVDILGAATFDDQITWWENDGNESFSEHIVTNNFDGARSVYSKDMDNDGDIDILGASQFGDDITWWENDGNQTFTEHVVKGNFDGASDVSAFDLDNDGDTDILGAATFDDQISWWENDGNQNFTEHIVNGNFDGAVSVFVADMDNDGDADILGTALVADDIVYWEHVKLPAELNSSAMNNSFCQGDSIIYSSSGGSNYEFFVNRVSVQNGVESSWASTSLNDKDTVHLVLTNENGCQANSVDFITDVSDATEGGILTGGTTVCPGVNSTELLLTDYVGDIQKWHLSASPDFSNKIKLTDSSAVLTVKGLTETTYIRAIVKNGNCPGEISTVDSIVVDYSSVGGSISGGTNVCNGVNSTVLNLSGHNGDILKWQSSVCCDFTNPLDIDNTTATYVVNDLTQTTYYRAVVNAAGSCDVFSSNEVIIVENATAINLGDSIPDLNNGMLRNTKHIVSESTTSIRSVHANDIDNDGDIDILGSSFSNNELLWWENDGNEVFEEHLIDASFTGAYEVFSIDIDGDGDIDLVGAAFYDDQISWWENDGSENFTEHIIANSFNGAVSVFVCDFDNDGDIDVLGAAQYDDEVSWWENDGNEVFTKHVILDGFNGASDVFAADLDDDGDLDVLASASNDNDVIWLENEGFNNFTEYTVDFNFYGALSVFAKDIDGDGDLDILSTASYSDDIAWWENDLNGSNWTKHIIDGSFNGASNAIAEDFDGDGDIDILGVALYSSEIAWWENNGSELFIKHIINDNFNYAYSVDISDMDNDGDLDVLGSSSSLNQIIWWENVLLPADLFSSDLDNVICSGDSITFSSSQGINYEFFVNEVSIQNGPDSLFVIPNLMGTDTVKVIVTNINGCHSTSVDYIIDATTEVDGGSISGGSIVCSGINNVQLALTGHIGQVKRWQSSPTPDFNTITNFNNTTNTMNVSDLTETTYYRVEVYNNPCGFEYSSVDSIVIDENIMNGQITGGITVCSGINSTELTLSGHSGTVEKWQSSITSDFNSPIDIISTDTFYVVNDLQQTRFYRAIINTGSCIVASSIDEVIVEHATSVHIASTINDLPNGQSQSTEYLISDSYKISKITSNDIDGDGDIDIVGASPTADDIAWWENDGTGSFTEHVVSGYFNGAQSVFTIDLDNDGDIDILGTAEYDDEISWWENDGNEVFTEHLITNTFNGAYEIHASDIDGDGDIDVLGTALISDQVAIWENDGNQVFTQHILSNTFDGASDIFSDDLDGDGDLDIVAAATYGDEIKWWKNEGNLYFEENDIELNFNGSYSIHTADVDDDGDIDVLGAAINQDQISWWENDLNGTYWTKHIIDPNLNGASNVFSKDMDNDGDLDILGAGSNSDEVIWWENDGSEIFAEHIIKASFSGAIGLVAEDLDGDFDIDVAGSAINTFELSWWENVISPVEFQCSDIDNIICVGDSVTFSSSGGINYEFFLNGSSIQNGSSNTWGSSALTENDTVSVILTNANGCQAESVNYFLDINDQPVGGTISGGMEVCYGINNNQLILSGYVGEVSHWESSLTHDFSETIIYNITDTVFNISNLTETMYFRAEIVNDPCFSEYSSIDSITIGTNLGGQISGGTTICGGDNSTQLTLSGHSGVVEKWQSASDITFSNPIDILVTDTFYIANNLSRTTYFRAFVDVGSCLTISDIDEIVVINATSISISTSVNDLPNGESRNSSTTIDTDFSGAYAVQTNDVDGDGDTDIIGAAFTSDDIVWWENDGNQNMVQHTIAGNFDGVRDVFSIDLDGDGDIDVLGAAYNADDVTWWENDGSEVFTEHTIDGSFNGASSVYAIDMDNDGDIDVLATAENADDVTWWENDGSEVFTKHSISTYFNGARDVMAIDLDSDGDMDIVAAAVNADDIVWWENDGSLNFNQHTIDGLFNGASSIYATDMDNDGDIDVLGTAFDGDDVSWWENDGNEVFSEHAISTYFNGARDAFANDLDGDGDMDVVATAYNVDDIVWWENDGNQVFSSHTIFDGLNGANSVCPGDIDGDGDMDIVGAGYLDHDVIWWENVLLPAELVSSDANNEICEGESITFSSSGGTNYEFFLNRISVQSGSANTWTTSALMDGDTVHVEMMSSNGCIANSVDFITDVSPITEGGEVSGGSIVCPDINSTQLTLNNYVGDIVKWQYSSTSDFASVVDIVDTSDIYFANGLSEDTYFRAVVLSGGCQLEFSTIDSVLIDFTSIGGSISGGTIVCNGPNSTLLTLSGYSGSIIKWQSSHTPSFINSIDISNTSDTYTAVDLTQTTYFRAIVSTGMCEDFSDTESIIVETATEINIGTSAPDLVNGGMRNTENTISNSSDGANNIFSIDLDGDGDIDLLCTASNDDEISWWENDGNGSFIKNVISSSFDGANSVHAIDVDGDGDIDVCGTASIDDAITWWENDGSEVFTEHIISSDFMGSSCVYAEDIDKDGDIDFLGAAYSADEVTWWENDGNQNFISHSISTTFDGVRDIEAIDLDGDGDIDILGAAFIDDDISWWENLGNEVFVERSVTNFYFGAYSVHAIDVDSDGDLDLISSSFYKDEITWWENDGNEVFSEHTIADSFDGANNIFGADLDGDEDVDILGTAFYGDRIAWWENDGNESFTEHNVSNFLDGAGELLADDLDGDGDLDVAGTAILGDQIKWWENVLLPATMTSSPVDNSICQGESVTFYASGGSNYEFFHNRVSIQNGIDNSWVANNLNNKDTVHVKVTAQNGCYSNSVDFITDVFQPTQGGNISGGGVVCPNVNLSHLTINNHVGTVQKWQSSLTPIFTYPTDILDTSTVLTVSDISETTYYRALLKNGVCNTVFSSIDSIVMNMSTVGGTVVGDTTVCYGTNSSILTLSGQIGAVQYWQSSQNSNFINPTDIAHTAPTYSPSDLLQTTYFRALVNAGTCDIFSDFAVVMVESANATNISPTAPDLPDGIHRNTENTITNAFAGVSDILSIDMDQDGDIDILGSAEYEDAISWWENDGSGIFSEHSITTTFLEAESVTAEDIDGDGDYDILGVSYGGDGVKWWENDGSESFTEHTISNTFDGAKDAFVADLDSDGDMDILGTSFTLRDVVWWENDGSQSFTENIIDSNFSGASEVYVADMDDDGYNDVIASSRSGGDIVWWKNDGNQSFSKFFIATTLYGVESIFSIDLNQDGKLDIIAGAQSLNDIVFYKNIGNGNFAPQYIDRNFYGASGVYASDIDSDGDLDIVATAITNGEVAWYENNGSTQFAKKLIVNAFLGANDVVVADIDGNGTQDVIGAANIDDDILWWENVMLPAPLISSNIDTIYCGNEDITYTSNGFANYEFFLNRSSVQNGSNNIFVNTNPIDGDTVHLVVTNANGCQANSVDFIIKTVDPSELIEVDTTYISATICSDEFFVFNNQNLNVPGIYLDTLTQVEGCDSIISLDLMVDFQDSDGDGVCDFVDICPDTESYFEVDEFGCVVPCQVVMYLVDTINSGIYRAGQNIISNGLILSPNVVEFKAGTEITLEPDFEVNLGVEFLAIIEECDEVTIINIDAEGNLKSISKKNKP